MDSDLSIYKSTFRPYKFNPKGQYSEFLTYVHCSKSMNDFFNQDFKAHGGVEEVCGVSPRPFPSLKNWG